jgi:hypothetical protein
MMDELRPEKLLHDWWGNKYAVQGGASYTWPYAVIQGKPIRTTVEMTAVRPWTYTHNLMYDKYSHDKLCLGFPFGANLLHYAAKLEVPLPWDCSYSGYASYMRQGIDPIEGQDSVGSSYLTNYGTQFEGFDELYNGTARWLQGKIINTSRIENSLRIGIFKHQRLFLSQSAEKTSGSKWENQIVFGWQLVY